ncbi:hypothetical protein CLF_109884 [Clonorchis sinensis]|uniref:Uncharacterized protein n=1 Tax=Clonorchis sinensis TaxID=79923 RepID=G7YJX0_CLOSI|nr:hypothetical protein CLF_109884 [Clonorchis sinensis]
MIEIPAFALTIALIRISVILLSTQSPFQNTQHGMKASKRYLGITLRIRHVLQIKECQDGQDDHIRRMGSLQQTAKSLVEIYFTHLTARSTFAVDSVQTVDRLAHHPASNHFQMKHDCTILSYSVGLRQPLVSGRLFGVWWLAQHKQQCIFPLNRNRAAGPDDILLAPFKDGGNFLSPPPVKTICVYLGKTDCPRQQGTRRECSICKGISLTSVVTGLPALMILRLTASCEALTSEHQLAGFINHTCSKGDAPEFCEHNPVIMFTYFWVYESMICVCSHFPFLSKFVVDEPVKRTLESLQNDNIQIVTGENLIDLEYADNAFLIFEVKGDAQGLLDKLTIDTPFFGVRLNTAK